MQEAVVLFNGIHIPDSVTKRALAWARENEATLKAIFLQGGETDESYGFPSDLDSAQELATTADATTDDTQLIDAKRRIFESSAAIENIPTTTLRLFNPDMDELKTQLADASIVFLSDHFDESSLGGVRKITRSDLFDGLPLNVEYVSESR